VPLKASCSLKVDTSKLNTILVEKCIIQVERRGVIGGGAGGSTGQFVPVNCTLIKRESVTAERTIRYCWIGRTKTNHASFPIFRKCKYA